jgi:hypothetical protein
MRQADQASPSNDPSQQGSLGGEEGSAREHGETGLVAHVFDAAL